MNEYFNLGDRYQVMHEIAIAPHTRNKLLMAIPVGELLVIGISLDKSNLILQIHIIFTIRRVFDFHQYHDQIVVHTQPICCVLKEIQKKGGLMLVLLKNGN